MALCTRKSPRSTLKIDDHQTMLLLSSSSSSMNGCSSSHVCLFDVSLAPGTDRYSKLHRVPPLPMHDSVDRWIGSLRVAYSSFINSTTQASSTSNGTVPIKLNCPGTQTFREGYQLGRTCTIPLEAEDASGIDCATSHELISTNRIK